MLNSPVVEVAIGLTFCFASVALMVSTIAEAISSLFNLRSRTLFGGIKTILNDKDFKGLALALYNNALVHPCGDGGIAPGARFAAISRAPAYIAANNFATALVESLQRSPSSGARLESAIDAIPDTQLRNLLFGMYWRADGELEQFEAEIAAWFDTAMDRVSGVYKRHAQLMTFLIGLAVALCFNVDSVHLCQELWKDPQRALLLSNVASFDQLHPEKAHTISEMAGNIQDLPLGQPFPRDWRDIALWSNLLGVLITASTAMFGAPFWFDMLQRLVQLRGAGPKPERRSDGEKNDGRQADGAGGRKNSENRASIQ
ncbi:MAG TPA: hypothetical protein VGP06_07060 [Janthinobacterium sp.]|nr:hypothetical protein [Janthinobacterium sp.]